MILKITPKQSLNEAIKNMHSGDTLLLEDGIYKEKVEIWVEGITVEAANPLKATIANKDYYHKIMPDYNECNTFNTFTLYVGSDDVTLSGLVIKNEAVPSAIYGQAVALHVDGDRFNCENCLIEGAQDTLFTGPMPMDLIARYQGFYPPNRLRGKSSSQKYERCTIVGDVDFIFGTAKAFFNECEIISTGRTGVGYICAPAHSIEQDFGYLFYRCKIKGDMPTYLARPWRDYGCAAFIDCELGSHVVAEGYNKWNNTNRDKTARFYEYSPNLDLKGRVSWLKVLSSAEANEYLENFYK